MRQRSLATSRIAAVALCLWLALLPVACGRPADVETSGLQLSIHECAGVEGALLRQGGGLRSGVRMQNPSDAEVRLRLEVVRRAPGGGETGREEAMLFGVAANDDLVLHTQCRELTVDDTKRTWLDVRAANADGSGVCVPCWLDDVEPRAQRVPIPPAVLAPGGVVTVFEMSLREPRDGAGGTVCLELRYDG